MLSQRRRQQEALKTGAAEGLTRTVASTSKKSSAPPAKTLKERLCDRSGAIPASPDRVIKVLTALLLNLPEPLMMCLLYWIRKGKFLEEDDSFKSFLDDIKELGYKKAPASPYCNLVAVVLRSLFAYLPPVEPVSDATVLSKAPERAIVGDLFVIQDLVYEGLSGFPFVDKAEGKRVFRCHCGLPPKFVPSNVQPSYTVAARLVCAANGSKCSYYVQIPAIEFLEQYLKEHGLDRLPMMLCPLHPAAAVSIGLVIPSSESAEYVEPTLRVRCTAKPKDSDFCGNSSVTGAGYCGPMGSTVLDSLNTLYNE